MGVVAMEDPSQAWLEKCQMITRLARHLHSCMAAPPGPGLDPMLLAGAGIAIYAARKLSHSTWPAPAAQTDNAERQAAGS